MVEARESECSSSSVILKKMRTRQRRAKALKLGPGAAGKLRRDAQFAQKR